MLGLSEQTRVFLRPGVTDGRLSFEGLRALAVNVIRQDVLLCVGKPGIGDRGVRGFAEHGCENCA